MKNQILRNRHTLLAATLAAFFGLVLLEANLADRRIFSFEIDNSFIQLRLGESVFENELEFLEDFGINIQF